MYRYAQTKNRVHRVIVEGGKAFQVEQCNLDDASFTRLQDIEPEGIHCAYCWRGWLAPTEAEKAAKAEEVEAFTSSPDAKSIPIVQATRRMALVALAGAALLGGALGVAASPDQAAALLPSLDPSVADISRRLDDLFVQIRVLQVDINGHTHEPAETQSPPIFVVPTTGPTAAPTPLPPGVTPAPSQSSRSGSTDTTTNTTTIIVVPGPTPPPGINPNGPTPPPPTPPPMPAPTAAPTPTPAPTPIIIICFRPNGNADPCKFPHQPH